MTRGMKREREEDEGDGEKRPEADSGKGGGTSAGADRGGTAALAEEDDVGRPLLFACRGVEAAE